MKKSNLLLLSFVLTVAVGFNFNMIAQEKSNIDAVGIPWRGANGISETVSDIVAREKRQPPQIFAIRGREEFHLPRKTQDNPRAPAVSQWPPLDGKQNSQQPFGITAPQTVGVNFLGIQISETPGYVPPDCIGDVGPTQVLVHVNGRIKVFDKNGTPGSLNVSDNTFWQSVRNGADLTDPRVRYDRISGRWFVLIINTPISGANRILIAVSSGPTITSSSSFSFYQFQHDQVGTVPNTDTGAFADYPTLGVDANALYIGANIFNSSTSAFIGTSAYVVRKSDLLSGTLTVTAFRQLTNGSTIGPYTPQGINNDDPTATEGYFIGVDAVSFSKLIIRRITNPGSTPSISSNISLTVPTTTYPINQVAQGSSNPLDGVDDRLFNAHIKKNKISGVTSLWTAHNIQVNSSGVGSSSGGRNGSRWYEIINLNTTPTLRQSGTLFSTALTNPIGYWFPSVAMSGQGHMALGCSYASVVNYAGVAVAGRLSSDALGTTQSPTIAYASSAAYNAETGGTQRWGDYSQVVVDPNDDMTMWTFQEYCNATNSWGLRVVQLISPPPATPLSTSPSTVNIGTTNVSVVVTGTSTSGSGFFDPGTGFSNRISSTINGGGVTVNNITFTSSTSITLNISIASDAALGLRTITVTNPDGQAATSVTGILTINNPICPTITLSPTTLPDGALGSSYNQSITASGGTSAYTYAVTSGVLPGGLTLSSAGLISGIPTTGGIHNFTITATDANLCTGNQAYALNITGCPTITLSPITLPSGTVGASYNQVITATGGVASYSYTVTTGILPSGMSLSLSGILSGTPTTPGTSNLTVTATDANNCTGSQAYSLTINSSGGSTISLVSMGLPYNQDFNILAISGTSSSVPSGWAFSETGENAGTTYSAGTGSTNLGDTWSYGPSSNTDRAFGGLQSSSLVPTIGANFTNNIGSSITSLSISYLGEEWRLGTRNRFDSLRFQYSLNATGLTTGTWVPFSSLDFQTPDTSGIANLRDGNTLRTLVSATIPDLDIPNGSVFWIRWIDVNATSSDDGLAVDDFSLTPNGGAPPCPTITLSPSTLPGGIIGVFYNETISANGGTSPYTFSVSSGTLPTGCTISPEGSISGTPITQGNFNFTIVAADSSGCTNGKSYTLIISCPSLTIEPSLLPSDSVGKSYNQLLTANGGTPPYVYTISSGTLPSNITLASSGLLSGTLSTGGIFNFVVTVTDANGCIADRAYQINVLFDAIFVSVPLDAQWNIVSNPVSSVNDSVHILFPSVTGGVFSYDISGYHAGSRLEPGIGYWVKSNITDTVTITGSPRINDTIDVFEGWNLIGSLSNTIPITSISGLGINIQSGFFGYNDSYNIVDSLMPGKGFWVKLDTAGKLLFTTSTLLSKTGSTALSFTKGLTLLNRLVLEDAKGHRQILYFGENNETTSRKIFELPPSPPQGIFDVRFASQRMAEVYSSPVVKSLQHDIKILSVSYPVIVRWEIIQNTNEVYKLLIQNGGKISKSIRLIGTGDTKIENLETSKLVLKIQSKNDIPVKFALHQNYPNPFNPKTIIEYQLPVESKVSIKIYNLLGQMVQTLEEGIQEEGYHSVEWNVLQSGIASGLYFYRMDAASTADPNKRITQIRKMILLK